MPQSTEGVLLVIGALFFLIGLLGGGFEVSAIKIPPIEKYPRAVVFGMGILLLLAGLFRIIVPASPSGLVAANTITAPATPTPAPTLTAPPPTFTPVPPTSTPPPPTATAVPATSTPAVSPTPGIATTPALPAIANFQDVTVDYDVTQFGQTGMLIHTKFLANGMKDLKGMAIGYFYDENGQKLISHDTKDLAADGLYKYQATDGQLVVWDYFVPIYDSAQFNDFQLFLPYTAIELPSGKYNLKLRVQIVDLRNTARPLAVAPDLPFSFSRK